MLKTKELLAVTALAGALVLPHSALADQNPIIDIAFQGLIGGYVGDSSGGDFTGLPNNQTSGFVKRLFSPFGATAWIPDWTGGTADFDMDMVISSIVGTGSDGDTALGAGSFLITDADGDTIEGNYAGNWRYQDDGGGPGADGVFFEGQVTDVFVKDNGVQDGLFNGPGGFGSFSLDFDPLIQPFRGTIVTFHLPSTLNWFDDDFAGAIEDLDIKIIPEPAGLMLGMIGLATVAWHRRRAS